MVQHHHIQQNYINKRKLLFATLLFHRSNKIYKLIGNLKIRQKV